MNDYNEQRGGGGGGRATGLCTLYLLTLSLMGDVEVVY